MPAEFKRGICCVKETVGLRTHWVLDKDIPIFTQDRDYITKRLRNIN